MEQARDLILTVEEVTWDPSKDQWHPWTVRAKLENTGSQFHGIGIGGVVSGLPNVMVPPVCIEVERSQDGHWTDITPMMDGRGIEYSLAPGELVLFDYRLPYTAEEGMLLRITYSNATSEPFIVPPRQSK